jgi:protein-S-isoprenylcysteine O-methyltransferase Ste14
MLPLLAQQAMLVGLFIQTDLTVLPISLVLSLVAKLAYLAFAAMLIVFFAIRYLPQTSASGLPPRFAALMGTFLSVGIIRLPPQELSAALYLICLLLMITGFGLATWATFSLGRSISIVPQARQLVTKGPYSFVRHPLYLGEMAATAGIALQYRAPWALLLFALQCAFQLWRMKNEERLLSRVFPAYGAYAMRTAKLMPGVC